MTDRKLATRYAQALHAALPPGAVDAADDFLSAFGAAVAQSSELRDLLLNPAVSQSLRKKVLVSLAEQHGAAREVVNFVRVVVDHGRSAELPAMAEVFHEVRERAEGVVPATVSTATPLPEDLEERLRAALERLSGQKVRVTFMIEPSLVGGVVTRMGSMVYDGTVRSHLAALHRKMAEE